MKLEEEEGSSIPLDESGQIMHIVCGHFGCRDPLFQMLQVRVTDWSSAVINNWRRQVECAQTWKCRPVTGEYKFEKSMREDKKVELGGRAVYIGAGQRWIWRASKLTQMV